MKSRNSCIPSVVVLSGLAILALASSAGAGQGIFEPQSTCTGNNCSSLTLYGTYEANDGDDADCFLAQLWTSGDECVRIHMQQQWGQSPDAAMVLTCPGGGVWRDDDSGGGTKPLIKAETFGPGWCTLQVCDYGGAFGNGSDFRVRYGRYNLGNRNCSNPTRPTALPFMVDGTAAVKTKLSE